MSKIDLDDPGLRAVLDRIDAAVDGELFHSRPILSFDSFAERLDVESPIELIFAWAFTRSEHNDGGISVFVPLQGQKMTPAEIVPWFDLECEDLNGFRTLGPHAKAGLIPQVHIGSYRVDFLIVFREWFGAARLSQSSMMVVECDGHEFHDRTKEQASRDRKRDRALQTKGLPVLRFTGSDLWRDPVACAEEAWQFIFRHAGPLLWPAERGDR